MKLSHHCRIVNFLAGTLALFSVFFICVNIQAADDHIGGWVSTRISIPSSILQEDRPIRVHLPRKYELSGGRYPVLFVLDADQEGLFKYAVRDAGLFADRGEKPAMIIVGIENTNRLRDMNVPDFEYQGEAIVGGAGKFLDFIEKELVPYIDEKYRTSHPKILFGGSASATFSIFAMVSRPAVFDAYIASSPSFFVNEELINEYSRNFFSGSESLDRVFFMNLGTEDSAKRVRQTKAYAALVERLAPPEFKWELRIMDGIGHVPKTSLEDGLEMVFDHIESVPLTITETRQKGSG